MAIPSSTTVGNLSENFIVPGAFPAGYVDQFVQVLDMDHLDCPGLGVDSNVIDTLPGANWLDRGATVSSSALATTKNTLNLQRLVTNPQLDQTDRLAACDPSDLYEIIVDAARTSMLRALGQAVVEGDGVAPNISGLVTQVTGGQTHGAANGAANGGAFTLADVDKLISLVTAADADAGTSGGILNPGGAADPGTGVTNAGAGVGNNRGIVLVMTEYSRRALLYQLRQSGITPIYEWCEALQTRELHYQGFPCLVGRVSETETKGTGTNLTSMYAVKVSGPAGASLVTMAGGDRYGVHVDDLPQPSDENTVTAMAYGYYGLWVPTDESIARMDGIDNSAVSIPA